MYQIKRCKECGEKIHVHKTGKHYRLKKLDCGHIPAEKREYATSKDIEKYLTSEIPQRKRSTEKKKQYSQKKNGRHHNKNRRR